MQTQMKGYIEKHLSPYLCGYRKGFNAQYALTSMIEKWKSWLDKNDGLAGAIFMDLSKASENINEKIWVKVGDEVIIFDDSLHTANDIALAIKTIPYEIVCGISKRIKRVYL